MHVPDGFFEPATAAGAFAVSTAVVTRATRRIGTELSERQAPLAGVLAAFVFSVQMLNFPVAAGSSGHLLGGVLAGVLVGSDCAVVCMAVVLAVQALFFADGGLSAIGINVLLMGIIPTYVGVWLYRRLCSLLRTSRRAAVVAGGIAAGLSVPLAAAAFAVLFAIGGAADVPFGRLLGAMVGVHVLIGIGEGVITAATLGTVVVVRPDLVRALPACRVVTRAVPA